MKKNKLPSIVTTAVLTSITIVTWIVFSVLRIFTSKPDSPVPPNILKPINGNLETNSLDTLEGKIFFENGENITTLPTPTPENTVIPEETPVPEESPTI
ncbi:MAG: hypothetical protein ABIJ85_03175 [bacterium]